MMSDCTSEEGFEGQLGEATEASTGLAESVIPVPEAMAPTFVATVDGVVLELEALVMRKFTKVST
jgi:hypothetical protein